MAEHALLIDGKLVPGAHTLDVINAARRSGVRIMPLLSNSGLNGFDPAPVHRLFQSPKTERALAGALLAFHDKDGLGLFIGMLHAPCEPIEDVLEQLLLAGAQHLLNVVLQLAPVAALRLKGPAAPQVQPAANHALIVAGMKR